MGARQHRHIFIVGDLVTIAPYFRNASDFDFYEKYIGIVVSVPASNEYMVCWTNSMPNQYGRGMWAGDHLVKLEDYRSAFIERKDLHTMEL